MTTFDEDFVVPEDEINRGFPKKLAKENAYYTAEINTDDPVLESGHIANDLELDGTSPEYEEALSRWREIQEFTAREDVISIISEPELDVATKSAVVRDYNEGKLTQNSLRDQYVQSVAAKDYEPMGEEDIPIRQQDIEAQELFLDKVEENMAISDDVQKMKTSFLASLNPSTLAAIGGLAAEVLSPVDLHALKSAYSAHNLGVTVTNEDIIGGEDSKLGVAVDDSIASKVFTGLVNVFETAISPLDAFLFDIPRNFLFSGSLNKKIADVYEQSTPEEKKEILNTVLESLDDIPGTDIQKWLVFQEQIELEAQDPLVALAGDVAGFAGAAGAAAFFRNPVKGVKWYTSFDKSSLPSFLSGAKQTASTVVDSSDEIATKADDVVKPSHTPTGMGNFNATDNITVSDVDITQVPSQKVKELDTYLAKAGETHSSLKAKVAEKVFEQSDEATKKGNIVVNVDAAEVEKKLPKIKLKEKEIKKARVLLEGYDDTDLRLIGKKLGMDTKDMPSKGLLNEVSRTMAERAARIESSNKAFKEADKKFVKSKKVDVKEASVQDDGTFSNIDMINYNVLRSNGMDEIPMSMGLESTINAAKNGLIKNIPSRPTIFDKEALTRMARPGVDPNSPAGILQKANPVKASRAHTEAIADATEETADHLGTTKGDIIYDSVLPKLDISLEETFPNIANNLRKIDEEFSIRLSDPGVNLIDEVGRRTKNKETTQFVQTFKENTVGTYNQANSTVHIGDTKAEGIATFGRNDNYGWATKTEAEDVLNSIKAQRPEFPLRVVERNGSYWVEQEWSYSFNHIDRWMFNVHSMDSSLLGIDTSAITRSALGDWIFPTTMKGNPDFAKTGFLSELKANSNEAAFFGLIRKEILATPHKKQLAKAMNMTQEEGRWIKPSEMAIEFPELNKAELESLANSYYSYKRGSEYTYEFANKIHRGELEAKDFKGIYTKEGDILGYGKEVSTRPSKVYSFTENAGVDVPSKLEGKKIIELDEPVIIDDVMYRHAIIDENINLGKLPNRTLPKIEGYIPRKNKENWFIDFIPKRMVIDGDVVTDKNILERHRKTVGAGRTKKEANKFAEQLKSEYGKGELKVRPATENLGDASLEDYKLYRDMTRNIKSRGERLPTLNGFTRLEDPLEAFADTSRTLTRINAWQPFKDSFERSFVKFADDFIPEINGEKLFPNDLNGLVLKQGNSLEDVKRFKVAQRLLSQYKEMHYNSTFGDRAWRSVFNNIANLLEDVKWAGPEIADMTREVGKQGNLLTRVPKTVASHLFIYLNPPRQWFLQPQQLLELNAISPTYAKRAPTEIPAIITAITSRAPHMKAYKGMDRVTYNAAKKASLMDPEEFDEIVDVIYNTGLPQAVDLNQMLYGVWSSSKFDINPTKARIGVDAITNTVSAPGKFGKTIGYTPAEMANNIGAWLFSLDRWKQLNPGKNWNTPENIARITADSWDINHSMIGRAGAMPFQKGALGVLFQFMAIQQKGFMQLLSSKTLSKAEKAKLATARLALYGGYGIPLGAIGLHVIDGFVDENASQETQQLYHANKGGVVDALTNTTLDVMFADEGTEWEVVNNTFRGKGGSDIAMSKAITPIPDGVPLYDMLVELSNFTDNNKQNPRFPGPQAIGSLSETVVDIKDMWKADTITSKEKLIVAAKGLGEMAGLLNNYGKALTMKKYRDKASKLGTNYGLDVTNGEILAQLFGFTTREEELLWANVDLNKEREQHISDIANEVFNRFSRMERLLGEQEYDIAVRKLNELLELAVEEEDIPEVKRRVEAKMEKEFKAGTIKSTLYDSIFNYKKNINSEQHREMIRNIRQSATRNEGDARIIDMLEDVGIEEKQ